MATLPPINRISREDLKDAPAWTDRLLYPINLFFDSVYRGLNKSLTFAENVDSQELTFTLIAGATPQDNTNKFLVTMKSKPTGLLTKSVTLQAGNYTPIGAAVFVEWYYDSGSVFITSITGLTNGSTYYFSLLLI
jgi:hypothetical protein